MKNIEQMKQYGFVIKQLVSREIKRKYSRSYLGIIWSVLNPLLTMVVLSLIFTTIFKRSIENFPIYFLTGNILWQFFTGATNSAMSSVVDNRSMLTRVKFPKIIFPIARVYTALVNMGYTFIAYLLMLIVFRISFSMTMLLLPLIIVLLMLFTMGLSYILSVAYVFFGDIKYLYSVLLTLWMYCSALFYPISAVPEIMQKLIRCNPVYVYIACMRNCMIYATWPNSMEWVQMLAWGIGSYLVGRLLFRTQESRMMQII